VTLVDANQRRCAFLDDAVTRLGFQDRVTVVATRAELLGHEADFRAGYDVVTARGFGRPAVTAECAAPLLRVGGRLIVSEPPTDDDRWPAEGLALLGLELGSVWTTPYRYRSLVQVSLCPARYPRRVGVPAKRPLF
jgi:16S rRNA (guanine527-N7)-methyltransferase